MTPAPNEEDHPAAVKVDSAPQNAPKSSSPSSQDQTSTARERLILCFRNGCSYGSDLAAKRELAEKQARRLRKEFSPDSKDIQALAAYLEDPRVDEHSPACPEVNPIVCVVLGVDRKAAGEKPPRGSSS